MKMKTSILDKVALTALLLGGVVSQGVAQSAPYSAGVQPNSSEITETRPAANERDVDLDTQIEITFSKGMDANSLNPTTVLVREQASNGNSMNGMHGMQRGEMNRNVESRGRSEEAAERNQMRSSDAVSGTIRYADRVAVFTPDNDLKEGTKYTVRLTTGVKDSVNVALGSEYNWSFTTKSSSDAMPYNEGNNDQEN